MMFKAIQTLNIAPYVQAAYESDPTLIEKWHVISGSGLGRCVNRTVQDLEACHSLMFYSVTEGDKFVGYFGTEYQGRYLPTIFIAPKYRERRDEFWELVQEHMVDTWRAGIFSKNTPCMKFYAKRGEEIARIKTPDGEAALFQFKRSA